MNWLLNIETAGLLILTIALLYCLRYLAEHLLPNPKTKPNQTLNNSKGEKTKYEGNVARVCLKNGDCLLNQVSKQTNHKDCKNKPHNVKPAFIIHIAFFPNFCIRVYRLARRLVSQK
jgi:hypothetical protein